jgi:hypothetical protein
MLDDDTTVAAKWLDQDPAMTLRVYGHVYRDALASAGDALLGRSRASGGQGCPAQQSLRTGSIPVSRNSITAVQRLFPPRARVQPRVPRSGDQARRQAAPQLFEAREADDHTDGQSLDLIDAVETAVAWIAVPRRRRDHNLGSALRVSAATATDTIAATPQQRGGGKWVFSKG